MRAEALTHTGLIRPDNEDAFLVDTGKGILAVADGMGGHQAGEVASFLALKALAEKLKEEATEDPLARLLAAVHFANEVVYRSSCQRPELSGMGTTLTAAWVVGSQAFLAHVGDSRAYLFRGGQLEVLTYDHSYVGELVRSGDLTAEQARLHPHRNILTRALGTEAEVIVDTRVVGLHTGDRLLLCTDGLLEVVKDEEIAEVLTLKTDLKEAVQSLVRLALERGGPDNVTVVLGAYE